MVSPVIVAPLCRVAFPECRKNKTEAITLANHGRRRQSNEPIRTQRNACSQRQARENACKQVTISFGFTSDRLRKWLNYFATLI